MDLESGEPDLTFLSKFILCGPVPVTSFLLRTINGPPRTTLRIKGDKVQKMVMTVTLKATRSSLALSDMSTSFMEKLPCSLEEDNLLKKTKTHTPFLKKFIYLFFGCAVYLLLRGLFSGCGARGLLSSCRLLTAVASLTEEHRL